MEDLITLVAFVAARVNAARHEAKDRGATATEYALLVGFIAIVIAVGVAAFGGTLNDFFAALAGKIADLS
jgi:pilus assembly protein Flp/PilA